MKLWTRVSLKGGENQGMRGIVCGVQKNIYDKSEPTRYWVIWENLKKSDHEIDQLEIRK